MTTRWQSVHRPSLGCWIRKTEKAEVHYFEAARPSHDLKAADLVVDKPGIGEKPPPVDNLSAAPLTTSAPEFTTPTLMPHKPAKKDDIWVEIIAVLDAAEAAKQKTPNPTKEIPDIVQPQLIARGLKMTKGRIAEIAKDFKTQFPTRFQKRGARFR
jgi:hypothetical protein